MAFLKVLKGSCPGQILPLTGERVVFGRHPRCEIVVDNAAVSRQHAQILESHGTYFFEDLRSRNGSYLNEEPIEGRIELHDRDTLKICDVVFRFHEQLPAIEPGEGEGSTISVERPDRNKKKPVEEDSTSDLVRVGDEPEEGLPDKSSIISTLNAVTGSSFRLGVNPEAKLRAVLEIGSALGKVLDLDEVLRRTLDGLFKIFPQADEGFVLLKEPNTKRLLVKATKSRLRNDEGTVHVSMTVVKQVFRTGDAILSADALADERFIMSESLNELKIRSMMCVPLLSAQDRVLGVLQIDTKDIGQQFSQSDLDVMISVASQVSLAVENARLHEEALQQRVLERDLEFAMQVQLGFLPNERPKLPGYEFSDFYEAAHHVGGDYFDYIMLPGDRSVISLGDVAGKGVPAALLMARLFSSARYQLLTTTSIAEALERLNAELATSGMGHRFVTCAVALVDPGRHEVRIANAGHLPPIVRRADGNVELVALKESGMPLGITPEQSFEEVVLKFGVGDTLLLYTDGVTEAMNPKNDLYGRKRLSKFVGSGPAPVGELIKGIVADVERFCKGRPQRDDMCLVGLRRTEE